MTTDSANTEKRPDGMNRLPGAEYRAALWAHGWRPFGYFDKQRVAIVAEWSAAQPDQHRQEPRPDTRPALPPPDSDTVQKGA